MNRWDCLVFSLFILSNVSIDESVFFFFFFSFLSTLSHFTSPYVRPLEDSVRDDTHEIDTPCGYVVYYFFSIF